MRIVMLVIKMTVGLITFIGKMLADVALIIVGALGSNHDKKAN